MQVEIKIDSSYKEPKVIVLTDRMTDQLQAILQGLSEPQPQLLTGTRDGVLEVLEPSEVVSIYSSGKKVFAKTLQKEYVLKSKLYELEKRLDSSGFIRISKSEIVNFKKVKNFDLSLAGTIRVVLLDGTMTYASRRYVKKIKQVLGM